jgi:hypothetical protein
MEGRHGDVTRTWQRMRRGSNQTLRASLCSGPVALKLSGDAACAELGRHYQRNPNETGM